jgi:hypothetical protein
VVTTQTTLPHLRERHTSPRAESPIENFAGILRNGTVRFCDTQDMNILTYAHVSTTGLETPAL